DSWEIVASDSRFKDKNVEVVTEEIKTPDRRKPRSWTIVRRKQAVVIAPMTAEGKLILICQERIPIRAAIWEVPAGQIDDESESILDCRAFTTEELRSMIARNEIRDANTLAICARLLARGLLSFGKV